MSTQITEPRRVEAPGIEVTGVARAFGAVQAVDHADLVAFPGEVTVLVGPNGCGKTTLMLMLAGLLAPDRGSLRVAGMDPMTHPLQARARVGWMPDGFGTWESLTVREVLTTVAAAHRLPTERGRTRVAELLRTLHLADLAERPARVLSRGQTQRLGLAQALVHDPDVLLLDEPASGLDPRSRIELRDVVRGLAARGATVLISSHILTELEEMSDRAVIMSAGRMVASHDLRGAATRRIWRITSLDGARLRAFLADHAVQARELDPPPGDTSGRGAVEVPIAGDDEAGAFLSALVDAGVPVFAFTPLEPGRGFLETAYLQATEERS